MTRSTTLVLTTILTLYASGWAPPVAAQPYNPDQFREMKWRGIGPYRGGRCGAYDRRA